MTRLETPCFQITVASERYVFDNTLSVICQIGMRDQATAKPYINLYFDMGFYI